LIFRFFKSHNWLAYKSFKSHTFNAWKLPRCVKTKHSSIFFPAKNNKWDYFYISVKKMGQKVYCFITKMHWSLQWKVTCDLIFFVINFVYLFACIWVWNLVMWGYLIQTEYPPYAPPQWSCTKNWGFFCMLPLLRLADLCHS
jgi:hypothetical protein